MSEQKQYQEPYRDAALPADVRAADLLSRLSLEEKMAQVNCLFPWHGSAEADRAASRHGIGQVSTLLLREFETLEAAAAWQRKYQTMVMAQSEHHIPAVFHMEGLCGAFLQGAVSFPTGLARAASFDPALEEQVAAVVSRQELSAGITQVLAPVLDLSRDSRLGRQGETYGEDPALAAAMGAAYVRGIQKGETAGRHAESEAKHFLGFHASLAGIHGANVELGERQLKECYAKPFQCAITESELRGVMPCYCAVNGEPVSASHKYLTEWLRGEMGFDGVTGADYGAVSNVYETQHVGESLTDAGQLCLEAGLDIEQQNCICYNDELKQRFADGRADPAALDAAVLRILRAKFRMGLFEHPFALEGEALRESFFSPSDAEVTLRSALEALVLLKNDGTLPLQAGLRKIAVVGTHAKNARSFFGGYTHISMEEAVYATANSIAGLKAGTTEGKEMRVVPGTRVQWDETEEFDRILRRRKPDCPSLLEQLRRDLPGTEIVYAYGYPVAGDDVSHLDEALEVCRDADVILMTLGGKYGSCSVATMGEGVDGAEIGLPYCQEEWIRRASALGIPMVGIHFNGRPISSDVADRYLNAILEGWSLSEAGAKALSMVLRGAYNPSGKLPVTTARTSGQIPIFYNHDFGSAWHQGASIGFADYVDLPHTPRYCFGYGLSYTTFAYSDLVLERTAFAPEDTITGSFCVTNTGALPGVETAQLYFTDPCASCVRPVRELAGFCRVSLNPGERKTVSFAMRVSQTAFLDRVMRWKVEKGELLLQAGGSSEALPLSGRVYVTENRYIDGKTRGFYAACRVE